MGEEGVGTDYHRRNQEQINLPEHSCFDLRIDFPCMFAHEAMRNVLVERDVACVEFEIVAFAAWRWDGFLVWKSRHDSQSDKAERNDKREEVQSLCKPIIHTYSRGRRLDTGYSQCTSAMSTCSGNRPERSTSEAEFLLRAAIIGHSSRGAVLRGAACRLFWKEVGCSESILTPMR
jgi:hypothetical protein